ncbi:Peptide methionine sulfoxide reductase MsrA 2 [Novipirellula galeiformis]|uniref:Peptide methionine sulfoxide reductase MsrA n=1 Tax=Novipirellula galeiformis TaxID=2528004 RepID=A0A5C6CB24_9BACT|nr:Peptide methionine sulfoxide reductase MsrA 2 [Novipirellula galeiformis]
MFVQTKRYVSLAVLFVFAGCQTEPVPLNEPVEMRHVSTQSIGEGEGTAEDNTAILGGGCFWCVESDFEKLPGVTDVVSGYSGGRSRNPTYATYAARGHIEVVKITYDPSKVNFAGLVEWLIKHSDPTDPNGSFVDRGHPYRPVVYYQNDRQKKVTEKVIKAVDDMHVFDKKLAIAVQPEQKFWPAEAYHQDYHSKSLIKYDFYRYKSGRDAFIEKHWGDRAKTLELPESMLRPAENHSHRAQ